MSAILETEVWPDRLHVTMKGPCEPHEVISLIDRTRDAAESADVTKVMVDCRGLEVELTETDRFQAGLRVAEKFGARFMVAVVMPQGKVTKMGELAAANRGARMMVTETIDEAEAWLSSQGP